MNYNVNYLAVSGELKQQIIYFNWRKNWRKALIYRTVSNSSQITMIQEP